ncbi:hypothetical protein M0802_012867 [Mischocyttarus mexicanus]|nr:hypothetical protein M0802_012867 [Mischocyttarus mexicanus]
MTTKRQALLLLLLLPSSSTPPPPPPPPPLPTLLLLLLLFLHHLHQPSSFPLSPPMLLSHARDETATTHCDDTIADVTKAVGEQLTQGRG